MRRAAREGSLWVARAHSHRQAQRPTLNPRQGVGGRSSRARVPHRLSSRSNAMGPSILLRSRKSATFSHFQIFIRAVSMIFRPHRPADPKSLSAGALAAKISPPSRTWMECGPASLCRIVSERGKPADSLPVPGWRCYRIRVPKCPLASIEGTPAYESPRFNRIRQAQRRHSNSVREGGENSSRQGLPTACL